MTARETAEKRKKIVRSVWKKMIPEKHVRAILKEYKSELFPMILLHPELRTEVLHRCPLSCATLTILTTTLPS